MCEYNYIFYTYASIITLGCDSERNSMRAEEELVCFVYVNIGFAAYQRITFAEL